MRKKDEKVVKAYLVATIDAHGAFTSLTTLPEPPDAKRDGFPLEVVIFVREAANFTKAARACVDTLRVHAPSWLRFLKSQTDVGAMKNLQGHAVPPKAWTRGSIKRPSARVAR